MNNRHPLNPERLPKGIAPEDAFMAQAWADTTLPAFPKVHLPEFNLSTNKDRWLKQYFRSAVATEEHRDLADRSLLAHGTTLSSALEIIKSGKIRSYHSLAESGAPVADSRLLIDTDELDIQLGLHKYAFLSVGRVHPVSIHDVYFCFPNTLLDQADTCVALREIVHFGAMVSKVSIATHVEHGVVKSNRVQSINQEAARKFFANLFSASDFREEIFPRFLAKEYEAPDTDIYYATQLEYPGVEPSFKKFGHELIISGVWEGPQAIVPDLVDLDKFKPAILIADQNPQTLKSLLASGFPEDRIFNIAEAIPKYFDWSHGKIEEYGLPLISHRYINLALRDISMIAAYNRTGQSLPERMLAFQNRAD